MSPCLLLLTPPPHSLTHDPRLTTQLSTLDSLPSTLSGDLLRRHVTSKKALIITNDKVGPLYLDKTVKVLLVLSLLLLLLLRSFSRLVPPFLESTPFSSSFNPIQSCHSIY